jgi:hypothetical protein
MARNVNIVAFFQKLYANQSSAELQLQRDR